MKKFIIFLLFLGLTPVFIVSCKKNTNNFEELQKIEEKKTFQAVCDYVLLQDDESQIEVGGVKNFLNENEIFLQKNENNEKIAIIAIEKEYKTPILNAKNSIKFLVSEFDENDKVKNGTIVEIVSENSYKKEEVIHLISSQFSNLKNNFNGSIIHFSLNNEYLYEIEYKLGIAKSKKIIQRQQGSNELSRDGCVYYFWVEYDTQTGIITNATFMYQICSGIQGCEQTRIIGNSINPFTSKCGAGGGGGGSIEYIDIDGYRKPFSKNNFRYNLGVRTGLTAQPSNINAHHVFPQTFITNFTAAGIDIHNPDFGVWWLSPDHQQNSAAYNQAWANWFALNPNPTANQIKAQGRVIMASFGFTSLNY